MSHVVAPSLLGCSRQVPTNCELVDLEITWFGSLRLTFIYVLRKTLIGSSLTQRVLHHRPNLLQDLGPHRRR